MDSQTSAPSNLVVLNSHKPSQLLDLIVVVSSSYNIVESIKIEQNHYYYYLFEYIIDGRYPFRDIYFSQGFLIILISIIIMWCVAGVRGSANGPAVAFLVVRGTCYWAWARAERDLLGS
jgi:hypothetical protein